MNKVVVAASAALLFACTAFAHPRPASARADCLSLRSKILGHSVGYCVVLPPTYDVETARSYPVLYLLHGLGDNEQFLIHTGGFNLVEDLWERRQLGEFLIVTPAATASFYINSRDGHQRYEDFLMQEFFPAIDRSYRTKGDRVSRAIAGISMGGFGALHLAFRHPRMFGSVAAHSAALLEKIPVFNSTNTRQVVRLRILGNVFGAPFDPVFWRRNDPIAIARGADLTGLRIYFDCGTEDDYGFDAGARALDTVLTSRHVPHQFHLYPGGHNWIYFAEHLPALLQFHSQVFSKATPRDGLIPR